MATKRCVYCGGTDHPAECGYREDELPGPFIGPLVDRLVNWILRKDRSRPATTTDGPRRGRQVARRTN